MSRYLDTRPRMRAATTELLTYLGDGLWHPASDAADHLAEVTDLSPRTIANLIRHLSGPGQGCSINRRGNARGGTDTRQLRIRS